MQLHRGIELHCSLRMALAALFLLSLPYNLMSTCPQNCTCSSPDFQTLHVDCGWNRSDTIMLNGLVSASEMSLQKEINSILTLLPALQRLSIIRSSLCNIPSQICLLSNLTALDLSDNQFQGITDGCLTKLKQLHSFTAQNNNRTVPQVCTNAVKY